MRRKIAIGVLVLAPLAGLFYVVHAMDLMGMVVHAHTPEGGH